MWDVLAESLWFDKDVEVALLQLLREHGEDARLGAELCQMIHDQLQQQLKQQRAERSFTRVLYLTPQRQEYHMWDLYIISVIIPPPPKNLMDTIIYMQRTDNPPEGQNSSSIGPSI